MRRAHLVLTPCFGKAVRFGFSIAVPLRFFAVFALVAYYLESLFPELLRSVCRGRPSTKRLVGLGTRSFLWVIDPMSLVLVSSLCLGTRSCLWVIDPLSMVLASKRCLGTRSFLWVIDPTTSKPCVPERLGTRSFLWVIDPVFPPPLLMSRLGTRTFLWVIYVRQDGCPS